MDVINNIIMIDEQKLNEIMMILGIGKNDVARDYSQEPIRFLFDKERIELYYDEYSGCWYINNDVNRQMWFSQFNGIYISFDEHFKQIQKYGSGEFVLRNGLSIDINKISYNDFKELVNGKEFEVSIKAEFHYYIYNKNEYSLESDSFYHLVDTINANFYEALSDKIIRKGNCYILTEIEKQ